MALQCVRTNADNVCISPGGCISMYAFQCMHFTPPNNMDTEAQTHPHVARNDIVYIVIIRIDACIHEHSTTQQ